MSDIEQAGLCTQAGQAIDMTEASIDIAGTASTALVHAGDAALPTVTGSAPVSLASYSPSASATASKATAKSGTADPGASGSAPVSLGDVSIDITGGAPYSAGTAALTVTGTATKL